MQTRDVVAALQERHHYNLQTAMAYVDANGFCAYCDEDVFECRVAYRGSLIDHLLPKSVYPELEQEPANAVLTCIRCNEIKRAFDAYLELRRRELLLAVDGPLAAVQAARMQLINEVRAYLAPSIARDRAEFASIKVLLRPDAGPGPAGAE